MKHATSSSLDRLEDVLRRLRQNTELREKQRGVFYHRSRAFLHFHEDPAGLFADVRLSDDFERLPVNTASERTALLRRVAEYLKSSGEPKGKAALNYGRSRK